MEIENLSVDAVVVGAGVLGLAISRALAAHGMSVACVGPDHTTPGTASSAAGAMLSPISEISPDWDKKGNLEELEFRIRSSAYYADFLLALNEDDGGSVFYTPGSVVIANLVNESDRRTLAAMRAAAHRYGLRAEPMDPDDVPGLRPARGYDAFEALFLPEEGAVDTVQLLRRLDGLIRATPRAHRIDTFVSELLRAGDRIVGARTAGGSLISAPVVVLAAGAGVQALMDGVREACPGLPRLLAGKGVSAVVTGMPMAYPHVVRTPNRDFACGTHVVPRGDGSIYIGATNRISGTPGSADSVTPGEVHSLLHAAMHEINTGFRAAAFRSVTYGMRPLTTDYHPLVGRTPVPGLYVATGTYRNGLLMAPLIADIVSREVRSGAPADDNPFPADGRLRPANPLGDSIAGIVEEGIGHLASFLLEPGGHLPYDRYRELRSFLIALGRVATDEDDSERAVLRSKFAATPMSEIVPQLFYELADRERAAPQDTRR